MMASEVYNSLERFLLFRKLYPIEKEALSFTRVSEALKQDEILLSTESFDATRLEPDALQSLYLQILKEEAKVEKLLGQDGPPSPNPRKRKLSSPRLETLEEAAQYAHLLPELVDRLYFNYQRHAVEAIRKEEFHYHSLQGKIGDKEKKEYESRQVAESSRPASHGVPSIQTLLRHEEEKAAQEAKGRRPSYPNGSPYPDPPQPLMNGAPLVPSLSTGAEACVPSNDPRYVQPNGPPHLPPPQYPAPPYSLPPPGPDAQRQRSSQPLPSPSPRMNQGTVPAPDRSSASPIILPPVSGMLRSQGTPAGSLEPVNEASQPYRTSANMSPRPGQPGLARPHNSQVPASRNYSHPTYPYHDGRQYSAYSYGQQGYYPQYPVSNISQGSSYGTPPGYPSPGPTHPPQHPGYYPPQGYYSQSPMSTSYSHQQPPRYSGQQTPKSDGVKQPIPLSPVKTSTSSTKWKDVDLERGAKPPGSPTRPLSREVSPISDRDDLPDQDATSGQIRVERIHQKGDNSVISVKSAITKGRPGRKPGRGGHAGAATTPARGHTRSQSVTPHADEPSTDAKASAARKIKPDPSIASTHEDETSTMDESFRKPGRRRRGTIREDDQPATPRTVTKRKRGDSSLPLPSPALNQFPIGLTQKSEIKALRKPGYVLATRNLQKISSTLMQTVTAHKDAYLFAKPLTERDAPGYDKLIFRPQDLKAIKSALVAGSRAVAAAIEGTDDIIDHASKSVWIPETADVVPPKGIVNAAQLEKELLRIFANAVMFNPELAENRGLGIAFQTRAKTLKNRQSEGNEETESEGPRSEIGVAKPVDGAVVYDTRKMCADVEEALDGWRGIGRIENAEAREAPVIGHPKDEIEEEVKEKGSRKKKDAMEAATTAGDEEEKEASEEPRPKRRRRQA